MKIAISGTMGSGKSQVANYLKEKGYTVSIADEVVEHLYNKDKELIKAMVDIFSSEILSWGKIDKNKLKDSYFKYPEKMQQANHLIHEKVYQHIEQMKDKHNRPLFFEIPLLFETNKAWLFDEIWFVEVSEDIRLERLINQRNMTQEEISEREQFHMKPILKKFMSDVIIDNELSISKLYQQIDENLERIHHDTK